MTTNCEKKKHILAGLVTSAVVSCLAEGMEYAASVKAAVRGQLTVDGFARLMVLALALYYALHFLKEKSERRAGNRVYMLLFAFFSAAILQSFCLPDVIDGISVVLYGFPVIPGIAVLEMTALSYRSKKQFLYMLGELAFIGFTGLICYFLHYQFCTVIYWIALAAIVFAFLKQYGFPANDSGNRTHIFERYSKTVFAFIASFGIILSIILPICPIVAWDDQIHYQRAFSLSTGEISSLKKADADITNLVIDRELSLQGRKTTLETLKNDENSAFVLIDREALDITRFGYAGFLPGIWMAKILNLPAAARFVLGKISNVVLYAFVFACAAQMLEYGKSLIAVTAMLPTCIFLAANYSYDGWTICFIGLGMACFFAAVQKEECISEIERYILLGAMVLAVLPKPGYAVLLLFLFLMPKNKFPSPTDQRSFDEKIFLCLFIIAGYFLLNYFLVQGAAGDKRTGGTDGKKQIIYMIQNPAAAFQTLSAFMADYLRLKRFPEFTTNWAYLGIIDSPASVLALLLVPTVLDSNKEKTRFSLRLLGLAICFVMIAATVIALYIDFTPVGLGEVWGCQQRYKLPILFAFLMFAGNGWIDGRKIAQTTGYRYSMLMLSSVLLIYTTFILLVLPSI